MCYLLRRHLCNCPAEPFWIPCSHSRPFLKSTSLLLPWPQSNFHRYSHQHDSQHNPQNSQQRHNFHQWEPYNRIATFNSICVHCAAIYNLLTQVNLPGLTARHVDALMEQIRYRMYEREQAILRQWRFALMLSRRE